MRITAPLLALVAGAALAGCSEEPEARSPRYVGVLVATPEEAVRLRDRCAYAVLEVAAQQMDCDAADLELRPVGASTFVTSGCGATATFLCDDDDASNRLSRKRRPRVSAGKGVKPPKLK